MDNKTSKERFLEWAVGLDWRERALAWDAWQAALESQEKTDEGPSEGPCAASTSDS